MAEGGGRGRGGAFGRGPCQPAAPTHVPTHTQGPVRGRVCGRGRVHLALPLQTSPGCSSHKMVAWNQYPPPCTLVPSAGAPAGACHGAHGRFSAVGVSRRRQKGQAALGGGVSGGAGRRAWEPRLWLAPAGARTVGGSAGSGVGSGVETLRPCSLPSLLRVGGGGWVGGGVWGGGWGGGGGVGGWVLGGGGGGGGGGGLNVAEALLPPHLLNITCLRATHVPGPLRRGRQVATDVAEALHFLHGHARVLHGDLKPG